MFFILINYLSSKTEVHQSTHNQINKSLVPRSLTLLCKYTLKFLFIGFFLQITKVFYYFIT